MALAFFSEFFLSSRFGVMWPRSDEKRPAPWRDGEFEVATDLSGFKDSVDFGSEMPGLVGALELALISGLPVGKVVSGGIGGGMCSGDDGEKGVVVCEREGSIVILWSSTTDEWPWDL